MNQVGRIQIYTDVKEITYENVIPVLQKALGIHEINAAQIDRMIRFEGGEQPIVRNKTFMPEINCQVIDNVASQAVDFWKGFAWSNQIVLVQRGNKENESSLSQAIMNLNDCFLMSKNNSKMQEIGDFVEKGGICYSYIDINMDWQDGESYFTKDVLDPRTAFIVKSSYYTDKRPMLGVSYRIDANGIKHYTCFSKDRRYEITHMEVTNGSEVGDGWGHAFRSGEENPLHQIPIVEWFRSHDYTNRFEKQIPALENLNLMLSDLSNGIEQNVMAVWHMNYVELPKEVIENEDGTTTERAKKIQNGQWLGTYTSPDGKQPFIKPLTLDYDNNGILNNYVAQRTLVLEKMHVPTRADTSGGSTGIAMGDATGWTDAETVASAEEEIKKDCVMNELRVVFAAIKESPFITEDNPLYKLRICDVEPNVRRPKIYELSTRVNSLAALMKIGVSFEDGLTAIPVFPDNSQVLLRSGDGVRKFQEANVFNQETTVEEIDVDKVSGDYADQITNSPRIDGRTIDNSPRASE